MTTANWVRLPLPIPPFKMTYEEFLAWAGDDVYAEWVDGTVEFTHLAIDAETLEVTMSVSKTHSILVSFLTAVLQLWAESMQVGELFAAPYQMKTGPELPGREPDVMFVAAANLNRTHEKYLEGPADAVFEIVSEESVTRDKLWKLAEYERGGVEEYWIIDPLKGEILLYRLGEDGKYAQAEADSSGILTSKVMPGVWFDSNWFWQPKLPAAATVLRKWGVL